MKRKRIAIMLCFALMVTMFVSPDQSMAKKAKIRLNKKKVTLYVKKSVRLKVKGTKKKVKWRSSKKKVAVVSKKGKVKAKKAGKARIIAKIGKKKLVCKVTVKNRKVSDPDDRDDSNDQDDTKNPAASVAATSGLSVAETANPSVRPEASADTGASSGPKGSEDPLVTAESTAAATSDTEETAGPTAEQPAETEYTGELEPTSAVMPTATLNPAPTQDLAETEKPGATGPAVPDPTATRKPGETDPAVPEPTATRKPGATGPAVPASTATRKPGATDSAVPASTATRKPGETDPAAPEPTATRKPDATDPTTSAPVEESGKPGDPTNPAAEATGAAKPTGAEEPAGSATSAPTEVSKPQKTEEVNVTERPRIPALSETSSFEQGTDGYKARGGASIQVVDGGYAADGSSSGKCLQISGRTAAEDGAGFSAGGQACAGESYTVQAYVKLESGSGTVKCMYQTGDSADTIHELVSVEVSGEWVKLMGTITVPQDFTKLDIWFEMSDASTTFYLDEVSLTEVVSIKDTYGRTFGEMGVCVNPADLENPETLAYIKKHYTSITLENDMKADAILRLPAISTETAKAKTGEYVIPESYKEETVPALNYMNVDKVLKLARKNGLKIRFHVLVWHSQTPEWFFKENYSQEEGAAYVSEETMYARMEMYIRSVMNHVYTLRGGVYRDVVYTWDVANEYMHNNADKNWSAVFGNRENNLGSRPPFIKRAFEIAYEMLEKFSLQDSVSLFYNDFNTYYLVTEDIVDMIHYINTEKEICRGIGMQSHIGVTFPSVELYTSTVERFMKEGFEIQITEMDVGCVDTEKRPDETTAEAYENQAAYVSEMMEKLIALQEKYDHAISGFTWWGLCDTKSWVAKNHALLFGPGLNDAKPSYFAFIKAAGPLEKLEPVPTPVPATAPPTSVFDFKEDDTYESESDKASLTVNEDGTLTITFSAQYAAVNFYLPDNAKNCKGYRSVELTYTSQGKNLSHSLYDGQNEKKTFWYPEVVESPNEEKTLKFDATADCADGCIRGLQIFNGQELAEGETITITVKSLKFSDRISNASEDSGETEATETPKPTRTPNPAPGSLDLYGISGGEQTGDGVVINDIDQVTIPMPASAAQGSKVKVTVSGTLSEESTGFRVWLAKGAGTASDQYYYTKKNGVGFGGQGDGNLAFKTGDFTITAVLTVGGTGSTVKEEDADNVLIKAPSYGEKMKGVTITNIQVQTAE